MKDKIVLKKYPNRRLYDTENSVYVTLDQVSQMVKDGRFVEVIDVKTSADVTPFILIQIIMEKFKKNNNLLPVSLLHLIIRFGENVLGEFFDKYLEKSIQSYLAYRKSMDEQFKLCLELGMDFSSIMTGSSFSSINDVHDRFDRESGMISPTIKEANNGKA